MDALNFDDNDNNFNSFSNLDSSYLSDLINNVPCAANVKAINNGKYIFMNFSNMRLYGLNHREEIIGATIDDLDLFMHPRWCKWFSKFINQFDSHVITKRITITKKNKIFLHRSGIIYIQNITKIPIFNREKNIVAIATFFSDITHKFDLIKLFSLYKKIYLKKKNATFYLSKHLNIHEIFREELSEKEMLCLIHMTRNRCYKYIAKSTNLSLKTIETHVSHILHKSRMYNMSSVLAFLYDGRRNRDINLMP